MPDMSLLASALPVRLGGAAIKRLLSTPVAAIGLKAADDCFQNALNQFECPILGRKAAAQMAPAFEWGRCALALTPQLLINARGHVVRSLMHRLARKVRMPGCRLNLSISTLLTNHLEAFAVTYRNGRKRAPKVLDLRVF